MIPRLMIHKDDTMTLTSVENTPETMPAGTRVARHHPTQGLLFATVTGWVGDSIGVRFDSGGTDVHPGSFRSYLLVGEPQS